MRSFTILLRIITQEHLIFDLIILIFNIFHYQLLSNNIYFTKNLTYMSSNALGQSSINPLFFLHRIHQFYYFVYIFLLLFLYQVINPSTRSKFSLTSVLLHPLTFGFLFKPCLCFISSLSAAA